MTTVRSQRWTIEVAGLEDCYFQHAKVECAWLHFWQPAGMDRVEVERIDIWMQPWGEEIAQIKKLDYLDELGTPDWVRDLVTDHWPDKVEENAVFDFLNWLSPQNITLARWDRDADGGLVPLPDGALWERWKTERHL